MVSKDAVSYAITRLMTPVVRTLKPKHVQRKEIIAIRQNLLIEATHIPDISMSEIFRQIASKMEDWHWVTVFKGLSLMHILIKDGSSERILGYLAGNLDMLDFSNFRDRSGSPNGVEQSKNIKTYSKYLQDKISCFKQMKMDWISNRDLGIARFRSLPLDEGLLKETEILQKQIQSLLLCSWSVHELDQVITRQAFRLLIWDMMALFHLLSEAVVRILSVYFELDRTDATRALDIYKTFSALTKKILAFFEVGRQLRYELGLDIPSFNHPPLSLANTLEQYLNAPDFEKQRDNYIKNKKNGGRGTTTSTKSEQQISSSTKTTASQEKQNQLIDFFSSIDEELSHYKATTPSSNAQMAFDALWDPQDDFSQRAAAVAAATGNPGTSGTATPNPANPFLTTQMMQNQLQQQLQVTDLLLQNASLGVNNIQQLQQFPQQQVPTSQIMKPSFTSGSLPFGQPQQQSQNMLGGGSAASTAGNMTFPFGNSSAFPPMNPAPTNNQLSATGAFGSFSDLAAQRKENPNLDPFNITSFGVFGTNQQGPAQMNMDMKTVMPSNPGTPSSFHSNINNNNNPFGKSPAMTTSSAISQPLPFQPTGASTFSSLSTAPGLNNPFGASPAIGSSVSSAPSTSTMNHNNAMNPFGGVSSGMTNQFALTGLSAMPGSASFTPSIGLGHTPTMTKNILQSTPGTLTQSNMIGLGFQNTGYNPSTLTNHGVAPTSINGFSSTSIGTSSFATQQPLQTAGGSSFPSSNTSATGPVGASQKENVSAADGANQLKSFTSQSTNKQPTYFSANYSVSSASSFNPNSNPFQGNSFGTQTQQQNAMLNRGSSGFGAPFGTTSQAGNMGMPTAPMNPFGPAGNTTSLFGNNPPTNTPQFGYNTQKQS